MAHFCNFLVIALRTNLHQCKSICKTCPLVSFSLWFGPSELSSAWVALFAFNENLITCQKKSWVWKLKFLETRVRLYSFHPLHQINVLYLFFQLAATLWGWCEVSSKTFAYTRVSHSFAKEQGSWRRRGRGYGGCLFVFLFFFYCFSILPLICHSVTVIFAFSMII